MAETISTDELRDFAEGFREGILGDEDSTDMCYAIACPLSGLLPVALGLNCTLVKGLILETRFADADVNKWYQESNFEDAEHWWLEFENGWILDPTADQFLGLDGVEMPPVYIGTRPANYLPITMG